MALPALVNLDQEAGERYLLHHWLVTYDDEFHYYSAWPVWYVVKPVLGQERHNTRPIEGWKIVRQDICPCCTTAVTPVDMGANVKAVAKDIKPDWRNKWGHDHCRKIWRAGKWKIFLEAQKAIEKQEANPDE